jgi:hypothetical protein
MGEEINATAIHPIQNPIHGDGCLLLHLAYPRNVIWHKDLLTSKANNNFVLQNLATATGILCVTAPTVSASSPNNLTDDAPGMLAGRKHTCTSRSHNGRAQALQQQPGASCRQQRTWYITCPPYWGRCTHHITSWNRGRRRPWCVVVCGCVCFIESKNPEARKRLDNTPPMAHWVLLESSFHCKNN